MVVPNCLAYKCQLNTYCMHSPTPHPTPMLYCNNWAYPHFLWTIVIILPDPSLSAIMQFMNSPYQIWQEGVERQFFIWCLIVEQVVAAAVRATGARLSVRRLVVEPSDQQGSSPPGPRWLHRQRAQSLRPWERTGLPPIYLLPPCVLSPNCDGHVRKYWLDLSIEPKYTLQNIATYSFYLTQVQSLH